MDPGNPGEKLTDFKVGRIIRFAFQKDHSVCSGKDVGRAQIGEWTWGCSQSEAVAVVQV